MRMCLLIAAVHVSIPNAGERALIFPAPLDIVRGAMAAGVQATRFGETIGALVPGRRADVVMVRLSGVLSPWSDPSLDPLDAVLYRPRRDDIDSVWVDGEPVVVNGCFTTVNETELTNNLTAALVFERNARTRLITRRLRRSSGTWTRSFQGT